MINTIKKAIVYLEDGKIFEGRSLFSKGESAGEVVFNTSMSGYQEIITDPSYAGQMIVMTYPLIGNYGVNPQDTESNKVHVKGFIVKELSLYTSNFRATQSLAEYLEENDIMTIENVDTRALTKHLRVQGAMRGIISTQDFDPDSLAAKMKDVPSMEGADWVQEVTAHEKYIWPQTGEKVFKVAALDCGIKHNIMRILTDLGCEVHIFPSTTTAEEILAAKPDGLFISNGPGDPAALSYVVETVKALLGKLPMFGICLGHQILGLALGGRTYKLKFGHRGANHPVKDLLQQTVAITSQNHGFCVDMNSLDKNDVEITHVNLNDQTVEGFRHKKYPLFCVQYHPEASPGPHDARYLFDQFISLMKGRHAAA